jgi:hypothetical protein
MLFWLLKRGVPVKGEPDMLQITVVSYRDSKDRFIITDIEDLVT